MKFVSNIYLSVNIDPYTLNELIPDYRTGDEYGYFFIGNKLVPKSLVERVFDHLCGITFDYGFTYTFEELFEEDFWSSLDDNEKSVIGACLLIVIENGYSIPIPEELKIKH